jgi:hypothetical protein
MKRFGSEFSLGFESNLKPETNLDIFQSGIRRVAAQMFLRFQGKKSLGLVGKFMGKDLTSAPIQNMEEAENKC